MVHSTHEVPFQIKPVEHGSQVQEVVLQTGFDGFVQSVFVTHSVHSKTDEFHFPAGQTPQVYVGFAPELLQNGFEIFVQAPVNPVP